MCMMCEGASPDEVVDRYVEMIDDYCWAVAGVDGTARSPGWAYTIGLTASYSHPELVIVACSVEQAHRQLQSLVNDIERGHRLKPGRHFVEGAGSVECRAVSTDQVAAGLIAAWTDVALRCRWDTTAPDVMQVEARGLLCPEHDRIDWDLSRPFPAFVDASENGGAGFRVRGNSRPGNARSARRGRRVSGDPRNRPRRWAS